LKSLDLALFAPGTIPAPKGGIHENENDHATSRKEDFVTKRSEKQQEKLAIGLTGLLADSHMLYHSTQICHWNVDGPQFHSLHGMFEEQYRELAEAIDTIAERIRTLGFFTPGTTEKLTRLSRIRQRDELRGASDMLDHLIEGHQQVIHRINEIRGDAEDIVDEATVDLLVERLRVHEKTLWMLRSQAGRESAELKVVEKLAKTG
jgi:starvation-inducible DNA-binding protein